MSASRVSLSGNVTAAGVHWRVWREWTNMDTKDKDLYLDCDISFAFHRNQNYLCQRLWRQQCLRLKVGFLQNCPFIFSSFTTLALGNLSALFLFSTWSAQTMTNFPSPQADWLGLLLLTEPMTVCLNRYWQNLIRSSRNRQPWDQRSTCLCSSNKKINGCDFVIVFCFTPGITESVPLSNMNRLHLSEQTYQTFMMTNTFSISYNLRTNHIRLPCML